MARTEKPKQQQIRLAELNTNRQMDGVHHNQLLLNRINNQSVSLKGITTARERHEIKSTINGKVNGF